MTKKTSPKNEKKKTPARNMGEYRAGRCVAFLRGINVGGHAPIKMADFKAVFENMGFADVRTVRASGNVIFKSGRPEQKALAREIESGLKKHLKLVSAFYCGIGMTLSGSDHQNRSRGSR